jgi:hypothetical protein
MSSRLGVRPATCCFGPFLGDALCAAHGAMLAALLLSLSSRKRSPTLTSSILAWFLSLPRHRRPPVSGERHHAPRTAHRREQRTLRCLRRQLPRDCKRSWRRPLAAQRCRQKQAQCRARATAQWGNALPSAFTYTPASSSCARPFSMDWRRLRCGSRLWPRRMGLPARLDAGPPPGCGCACC